MPSSTRTPVQNKSELTRLADNANTVFALLSAFAIVPVADAHRGLGTCSSMALELAQDLFALQGSGSRHALPVTSTEQLSDQASPALSQAEARLLAAFRKVKNRQRDEMLMLVEMQAKDFPARTKPVFQLIAGGAA